MKKIILLMFGVLGLATIKSCKEPEPIAKNGVIAEKTDVKTYEIIKLIAHVSLTDKYSATFGSATVELLKASDSTLIFIVPEVEEGAATLEFELAKINFNVTKTQVANPEQVVASIFQNFDEKVSKMGSTTSQEIADINSLKMFKQEVLGLFNLLSAEEKIQNAMFYEVNKGMFNSFLNVFSSTLNASTLFKSGSQSLCLTLVGKKSRGLCTVENIAKTAKALDDQLRKANFINEINSKWLSGAYLVMADAGPKIIEIKTILTELLNRKWILDPIFDKMNTFFTHDVFEKLNLNAELRSIDKAKDYYFLNQPKDEILFFDRIESLHNIWNKFKLLESFPAFVDVKESVEISDQDIKITDISNLNVEFHPEIIGGIEPSVKFKSLSGNKENFTFRIKVTKEGFVEEETIFAQVQPFVLKIGDNYQGGIICYILQIGDPGYDPNMQHGRIAAPYDQSSGAKWGCWGTHLKSGGANGKEATTNIVNKCSEPGIAARICNDLVLNGYDDWYLPNRSELYNCYTNRVAIGGFSANYYWASQEEDSDGYKATAENLGHGTIIGYPKNDFCYVRAVRSF